MKTLNESVIEKIVDGFENLLNKHITDIMKRSKEFTEDKDKFSVSFKCGIENNGRTVTITPDISIPGQKVTDGLADIIIDPESPELLMPKKGKGNKGDLI